MNIQYLEMTALKYFHSKMTYLPPQVNCSLPQHLAHHKDAAVSLLNYLNCYLGNLAYLSSLGTALLTAAVSVIKWKLKDQYTKT
jgi:hypothetical protein